MTQPADPAVFDPLKRRTTLAQPPVPLTQAQPATPTPTPSFTPAPIGTPAAPALIQAGVPQTPATTPPAPQTSATAGVPPAPPIGATTQQPFGSGNRGVVSAGIDLSGAGNGDPRTDYNAIQHTGSAPGVASASIDQALIAAMYNQTAEDADRIRQAGATAQQQLGQTAQYAAGVGSTVYGNALDQAGAALQRGDTGLATAQDLGQTAVTAGYQAGVPLNALGATDQAQAADARAQAVQYAAQTGLSLEDAERAIQALGTPIGNVAETGKLASFTGSAGTAAPLASFDASTPSTGALGAFTGSAGTSGDLAAFRPNVGATGQLDAFTGNAGTATDLAGLNTTVGSTARLGNFEGNAGNAADLEALNTGVSATGDLLGFRGTSGTAQTLADMPTGVSGTGALAAFQGTGGEGLNQLERFGAGADIGPSAAEALLRKASDQTTASNIAIARSGRGSGENAGALRQAIFTNAAQGQQLGNDVAKIRAEEAATARGQNIGAATAAAGTSAALSGQKAQTLTAVQSGQLQAEQDRLSALVSSGQMTQAQAAMQLDAFKTAQQGQLQSVAQRSTNLATAGEQRQVQAGQQLDALKTQQAGELQSVSTRLQALVASGQMTQQQAAQQLDALKATQEGQLAAEQQRLTALSTAGTQLQTQSAQQLAALQTKQQAETAQTQQRLDALVASGQMTQKQADQQLTALTQAQNAEVQIAQLNTQAQTASGTLATQKAGVQADLSKSFATIGLNYDVNSGNVYDKSGQLVMTGEQVNQQFVSSGLGNQAQQGANAANITQSGTQALTTLTNTSADAQKAVAISGPQTAAQIASLSQGQLAELSRIVQNQNAEELQQWAAVNGLSLAQSQQTASETGAIIGAIGTVVAGMALLSDVSAKTNIAPAPAAQWFDSNNDWFAASNPKPAPVAGPVQPAGMSNNDKLAFLNMIGGAGNALGRGIASDKKGKKEKEPESFREWVADFRPAKGYSYDYKDPSKAGAAPGRQYGPMANDLKKTAAKDAVFMGPDKMLAVDPTRVVMPLMAAAGENQRRIDSIDERLDFLEGFIRGDEGPKKARPSARAI